MTSLDYYSSEELSTDGECAARDRSRRFVLDNDVPDTVQRVLREAGHNVILLRHIVSEKSSDAAVLDHALAKELALICNRDDFNSLAKRELIRD